MQFRGEFPPIINSKICIPYKGNLYVFNPDRDSSFACRIILGKSLNILNININLCEDFSKVEIQKQSLFTNRELSDITIKVEGKEFYCQKSFLSDVSGFFRDMFQSTFLTRIIKANCLKKVG